MAPISRTCSTRLLATPLVLVACLLLPLRVLALPMPALSPDGSLLTGVVVGTDIYEVTFGDGVIGDLYPPSVVGQPGWFELVDGVKDVLY